MPAEWTRGEMYRATALRLRTLHDALANDGITSQFRDWALSGETDKGAFSIFVSSGILNVRVAPKGLGTEVYAGVEADQGIERIKEVFR